jgi:hypothetical protein
MSESENKLAGLKERLARENAWVKHHTDSAEQIKADIKALEEALAPKQGDIYQNLKSGQNYIVARVGYNRYCLINLGTGERFNDPEPSIEKTFGHFPDNFVKIKR